jgi:hypothetical protein
LRGIQKHYGEKHGWVNIWKKGGNVVKRAKGERQVPWKTGARCQRFFPNHAASGWFEVGRDSGNEEDRRREADGVDRVAEFLNRNPPRE